MVDLEICYELRAKDNDSLWYLFPSLSAGAGDSILASSACSNLLLQRILNSQCQASPPHLGAPEFDLSPRGTLFSYQDSIASSSLRF